MPFIKVFLIFIISFQANAKLEEIKTKQSVKNIRYITEDGRITYFLNQKGKLRFSSNYSVKEVIQGEEYDNFLITSAGSKDMIAISQIKNPHRNNSYLDNHKIYVAKIGSPKARMVGEGRNPHFHQNNNYISFFTPKTREIHLINLKMPNKKYKIKISNSNNPYFIPTVYMITPNDIIYTDINNKGYSAILQYSLIEKKFQTVYKSQSPSQKIELCNYDKKIMIGEFPFYMGAQSTIMLVDLYNNEKYEDITVLYSSPFSDIGNMICLEKNVYFIKTREYNKKLSLKVTDVAKLSFDNLTTQFITKKGDITQLSQLGKLILTPYKGKLLVVEGANKILDDSIIKESK